MQGSQQGQMASDPRAHVVLASPRAALQPEWQREVGDRRETPLPCRVAPRAASCAILQPTPPKRLILRVNGQNFLACGGQRCIA